MINTLQCDQLVQMWQNFEINERFLRFSILRAVSVKTWSPIKLTMMVPTVRHFVRISLPEEQLKVNHTDLQS